jgi:hypothetical protein
MNMALTQMQIIQPLGEAMNWFERELQWGVPPTELRHLSGRIGELYAALISNGQMATEVNQKGYDVVSSLGERISVKTTANMSSSGHISFNPNTLDIVDRVIILRINTEDMQIETLLDTDKPNAINLMREPNSQGKACISMSKLLTPKPIKSDIKVIKIAVLPPYQIEELETGSINALKNGELVVPAKPVLREIAGTLGINTINGNGNALNTRQLGTLLIKTILQ